MCKPSYMPVNAGSTATGERNQGDRSQRSHAWSLRLSALI
jgi:hypothetical protein